LEHQFINANPVGLVNRDHVPVLGKQVLEPRGTRLVTRILLSLLLLTICYLITGTRAKKQPGAAFAHLDDLVQSYVESGRVSEDEYVGEDNGEDDEHEHEHESEGMAEEVDEVTWRGREQGDFEDFTVEIEAQQAHDSKLFPICL
jgi:hypothetical protein